MTPLNVGCIGIAVLVILLFCEMPIGIVMAFVGFAGFTYLQGIDAGLGLLTTVPYTSFSTYLLSVVPLFILMGEFCFHGNISGDLYNMSYKILGTLRGGLAMATVVACAAFAAVSGSSMATAATIGTVALPEMKKYGYDSGLATGTLAAGGTIGILIPPSIIMVIYGTLTEQSIGKLFLAGFIPGILQALFFIIVIGYICHRNPLLGPAGPKSSLRQKVVALKSTWIVLLLFLLVVGGLYVGVFSPTEAAAVGAFGAFLFALGRRKLSWKNFWISLSATVKTSGMIFLIYLGAMLLGYFLAVTRIPTELAAFIGELSISRYVIFALIVVLYLILGCMMDSLAMILLTVPILFPLILSLGFDPIWFGIMIVIVVELGMITPPVGMNVFVIQGIAKDVPMYTIFRGVAPFIYAYIFEIILLTTFPQIVTVLPSLMK